MDRASLRRHDAPGADWVAGLRDVGHRRRHDHRAGDNDRIDEFVHRDALRDGDRTRAQTKRQSKYAALAFGPADKITFEFVRALRAKHPELMSPIAIVLACIVAIG